VEIRKLIKLSTSQIVHQSPKPTNNKTVPKRKYILSDLFKEGLLSTQKRPGNFKSMKFTWTPFPAWKVNYKHLSLQMQSEIFPDILSMG
jgi:hypothetical protein